MRIYFKFIFLVALAAVSILSCSKEETPSCVGHDPSALLGLWEYDAGNPGVDSPPPERKPLLSFFSEGTFSGNNSRNAIAGIYETTSPRGINIEIQRSTYAAESSWSTAFSASLQEVDEYCVDNNTLRLSNSANNLEFVFVKKEDSTTCLPVQQDGTLFQEAESDPFTLRAFRLEGTCLEVEISYGGGCGFSSMQLVVDEAYGESDPPVVGAKLVFTDNEPCEALVTKSFYFDLGPIQYDGAAALNVFFNEQGETVLVSY